MFEHASNAVSYAFARSIDLVLGLSAAGNQDIWLLPEGGGELRLVVGGAATEQGPAVSPDGRFIAYSSDRSGQREVYVEPFPDGSARVRVSASEETSTFDIPPFGWREGRQRDVAGSTGQ